MGNTHNFDNFSPKKTTRRRTKTGCLTCRQRRIKCDEEKPLCKNCTKSKRVCLGYDPIFIRSGGNSSSHNRLNSNAVRKTEDHKIKKEEERNLPIRSNETSYLSEINNKRSISRELPLSNEIFTNAEPVSNSSSMAIPLNPLINSEYNSSNSSGNFLGQNVIQQDFPTNYQPQSIGQYSSIPVPIPLYQYSNSSSQPFNQPSSVAPPYPALQYQHVENIHYYGGFPPAPQQASQPAPPSPSPPGYFSQYPNSLYFHPVENPRFSEIKETYHPQNASIVRKLDNSHVESNVAQYNENITPVITGKKMEKDECNVPGNYKDTINKQSMIKSTQVNTRTDEKSKTKFENSYKEISNDSANELKVDPLINIAIKNGKHIPNIENIELNSNTANDTSVLNSQERMSNSKHNFASKISPISQLTKKVTHESLENDKDITREKIVVQGFPISPSKSDAKIIDENDPNKNLQIREKSRSNDNMETDKNIAKFFYNQSVKPILEDIFGKSFLFEDLYENFIPQCLTSTILLLALSPESVLKKNVYNDLENIAFNIQINVPSRIVSLSLMAFIGIHKSSIAKLHTCFDLDQAYSGLVENILSFSMEMEVVADKLSDDDNDTNLEETCSNLSNNILNDHSKTRTSISNKGVNNNDSSSITILPKTNDPNNFNGNNEEKMNDKKTKNEVEKNYKKRKVAVVQGNSNISNNLNEKKNQTINSNTNNNNNDPLDESTVLKKAKLNDDAFFSETMSFKKFLAFLATNNPNDIPQIVLEFCSKLSTHALERIACSYILTSGKP